MNVNVLRASLRLDIVAQCPLTQFSSVGFCSRGERRFLLLSSAERARCRLTCFNVFVGDACVECECSWLL